LVLNIDECPKYMAEVEKLRKQVGLLTADAVAAARKRSSVDAAFAKLDAALHVQLVHEYKVVDTTVSASATTEALLAQAVRVFRLEGRNVSLLLDGKQRLEPGMPLSRTALVCSKNHMYIRNVMVKTEGW